MLTISHSHEEGTLLDGSRKGDGVYEIVRRHGFAFFPSIRAIGIRQSRDHVAKRYQINAAAEALRAAGHEVTVEIDDTPRERGTVLVDQAERLDDRADRLNRRAARHAASADAAYNQADSIAERFQGGQPIIMGHHSTRRALRDREKMTAAQRRGQEEQKVADGIAYAASRVGKDAAYREKPTVTRRRIQTTQSDLRVIQRNLDGYTRRHLDHNGNPYYVDEHAPASGDYREQLLARQALLTERLAYDRAQLAEAEAAGFVVWGPDNVHAGDLVRYWGGWKEVAKVNKVTVSCPTEYSWMDKVKFTDVREVRCTHGQPAEEPQPLESVGEMTGPEAGRHARMAASLAAGDREATETAARLGMTFPEPTVRSHQLVGEGATLESSRAERDARIAAALAAEPVHAPGYFPTPPDLAARMAAMLPEGPLTVLEPSAGDGALVRAVLEARPEAFVVAVEPNAQLHGMLGRLPLDRLRPHRGTFEEFDAARPDGSTPPELFGAVVMNPPFSAPGQPVLFAEHLMRAYEHLDKGGRLVAIVPAGFEYRVDRKIARVRELVEELGGWEPLPDGTFAGSGTSVGTILCWLDKPAAVTDDLQPVPAGAAQHAEQLGLWA